MIPPSYTPARLHCYLPQQNDGDFAFAFDTANGIVRFRLPECDALQFIAGLTEEMAQRRIKSQSDRSSGSPNFDGSPQEGQNV